MQTTCTNCNAPNPAGKIFCGSCGKALNAPAANRAAPTTPAPAPRPAQSAYPTAPAPTYTPPGSWQVPPPAPMPAAPPPPRSSAYAPPASAPTAYVPSAPIPGQNPLILAPPPGGVPANAIPVIARERGLAVSRKTWFSALAGAIAGLLASMLSGTFDRMSGTDSPNANILNVLFDDFLVICCTALFIGACLGAVEGLLARQPSAVLRGAARGAIIGFVAGFIDLIFAEIVFRTMGSTDGARQIAWIVFGIPFGAVEGFKRSAPLRLVLGMIGGALGGLVGGALANISSGSFNFGLVALGFFIGFFIGLLHDLFKQAWLKVMSGRSEGRELVLDQPSTVLGSGDVGQVDFGLWGDPAVISKHAQIKRDSNGYKLTPFAGAPVTINNTPVVQEMELHNGDRIQLGNTALVFRNKRE